MIIGVDLQTLETPEAERGIGRYARGLVENLTRHCAGHRIVGFGFTDRPPELLSCTGAPNFEYRTFDLPHGRDEYLAHGIIAPFGWSANMSDLDVYVLTSPLMLDILLPDGGPFAIVPVIHDLIPLLYRESRPAQMTGHQWLLYDARLELVKDYDFYLTDSEAGSRDVIDLLQIQPEKIRAIGIGVDEVFFEKLSKVELEHVRKQWAIRSAYVLSVTGHHYRKNWEGVFRAFASLPRRVRKKHQLVIVCRLDARSRDEFLRVAESLGIAEQTILTGAVDDATLRALYQGASALLFPSFSEGFGIPLIEAMASGVPIVASDIAVFREVAGQAARFVDPNRTDLLAAELSAVLRDQALKRSLVEVGRNRVEYYRWPRVIDRMIAFLSDALQAKAISKVSGGRKTRSRGERVAYFTPLPPQASGIADYNESLVRELIRHVDLELFVDVEPRDGEIRETIPWHFACDFPRLHREKPYDLIVYHVGNNVLHGRQYRLATAFPGVVFLHDYTLRFFAPLANRRFSFLEVRDDIQRYYGLRFPRNTPPERIFADLDLWDHPLNERLVESSLGVLVHSQWSRERIHRRFPEKPVEVLPFGIDKDPRKRIAERGEIRRRYQIAPDAYVLVCAGNLTPNKRLTQLLFAFAELVDEVPKPMLCLVGRATDPRYFARLHKLVNDLHLPGFVRFLGYVDMDELYDIIDMSDVCLNLRYPTLGETSGVLLRMMQLGKPIIVSAVAQFLEFPDEVCWKADVGGPEHAQLVGYLRALWRSEDLRDRLGRNARQYVSDWTWDKVAPLHVEAWRRIARQR